MHIDGYVIPVPEEKREEFIAMAEWFDQAMIEYGAIEVMEGWETDIKDGKRTDFRKAVMAEEGEKILFSWIVWPDKATAEAAHEKIHEHPKFKDMKDVPFDGKRMIFGSFEPVLHLRAG